MSAEATANDAVSTTVDARYGRITYLRGDDPIGMSLHEYGEWAQLELEFLLQFIRPGATVVDAGANIGTHTLAFSQAAGARGRILAFEPQQRIFELLRHNTAANSAVNVTLYRAALAGAPGVRYVPWIDYASHINAGGVSMLSDPEPGSNAVDAIPLDGLALDELALLKVDVEGMEPDVIHGASATLERCRPYLFIECNTISNGVEVLAALRGARYAVFYKRSAAFNPDNIRGNTDDRFGPSRESNLFCVPAERVDSIRSTLDNTPELFPIGDVDDLAFQVLRTPRYGDASAYDRDIAWMAGELSRAKAECAIIAMTLQRQQEYFEGILRDERLRAADAATANGARTSDARDAAEIERLRYRLAKQAHQLDATERRAAAELAALLERTTAAESDLARVHTVQAERRTAEAALQQQLDAAAAALSAEQSRCAELAARLACDQAAARVHQDEAHTLADDLRQQLEAAGARTHALAAALETARNECRTHVADAAQFAALKRQIVDLQTSLRNARNELRAGSDLVTENERLLGLLRIRIEETRAATLDAASVRVQLDDVRLGLLSCESEIATLRRSRSWRFTAPLRRLRAWFVRRLRR